MESKIEINAIVWSSNIDMARKYAEAFTQGTQNGAGFYTNSTSEYTLNTYIRCPSESNTSTPTSITDIVMVHVEDSDECAQAQKYLDSRRGIPMKVCLTTKLGEFDELECKNVNPSELGNERTVILKEALSFERTLINVFKKFDINGNGLISTDELISCSKELGHELTKDDAQMITDTLDKDKKGNIDFNGFKKWWVTGKSDFTNFRRVVKAEMAVNKLIKMTSTNFNDYLSNLNENSKDLAATEVQQSMNLNFHSANEFENGIGLFIDICSGPEAKEIFDSKPESLRNSPVFVTLSLEMDNNEIASQTAEILNEMIIPMLGAIPQMTIPLQMGLKINFRANQNKLVADVTVEAMLAEIMINSYNSFNIKDLKVGGEATLHIFTGVNLNDVKNSDLNCWELSEKAMNLKLHFNTKAYNIRGCVETICAALDEKIDQGVIPMAFKNATIATRFGAILRTFDLDFKFDPAPLIDMIILKTEKKNIGTEGYNQLNLEEYKEKMAQGDAEAAQRLSEMRAVIAQYIDQMAQMKEMVPPEFMDIIKSINLEKIELQFGINTDAAKVSNKITLNLPGLQSIKDQVLN